MKDGVQALRDLLNVFLDFTLTPHVQKCEKILLDEACVRLHLLWLKLSCDKETLASGRKCCVKAVHK